MASISQVTNAAAFDATADGAERVEIKVTVLDQEEGKAVQALGLDMAKTALLH
jgi:hypothetical protein